MRLGITAVLSALCLIAMADGLNVQCQKLLVPLYAYPTLSDPNNFWNQIATAGISGGYILVMNPNSGPTESAIADYIDAIALSHENNHSVIGYVHITYGTRDIDIVKSEIDAYFEQYPNIDGIFFDETATSMDVFGYHETVVSYMRGKESGNPLVAVFNPGVAPPVEYIDLADITAVFEGNADVYLSSFSPPPYADTISPNKMCHFVYSSSREQLQDAIEKSFVTRAAYIFITDDVLPNPWDVAPSYIREEMYFANRSCHNCDKSVIRGVLSFLKGQQRYNGLLESFLVPSESEGTWAKDVAYSYDQAVIAVVGMIGAIEGPPQYLREAERILNTMAKNLSPDVSDPRISYVPSSWNISTMESSGPFRSGNAAWVAYALGLHGLLTGSESFTKPLHKICRGLLARLAQSGPNQCVTGGPDVTWCSTEHNIDAYFALHLAGYVTGELVYTTAAATIAETLGGALWNDAQERFNQGISDPYMALDTQSWGAIWLLSDHGVTSFDSMARVQSALAFTESKFANAQVAVATGKTAKGYGPYADSSNSFNANTVWSEGSLGVGLAYLRAGKIGMLRKIIAEIKPLQGPNGGLTYSAAETVVNAGGDVFYPYESVAGSAWMLLACHPRNDVFWNNKVYSEYTKILE